MSIEWVGGYRVVRRLGEGPQSETWLGYPDATAGVPVAIKLYRAATPSTAAVAEAEALARARGAHVVELIDVASTAEGAPALILERLPGPSVARLLRDRARLRAGEAITILVPVIAAVLRMHSAGVVHGAVGADTVFFDGSGAPVLACFGGARLITPGLPPALVASDAGVGADRQAIAVLLEAVLSRVDQPGIGVFIGDQLHRCESAPDVWLDELSLALFSLADPEAVAVGEQPRVDPAVPGRVMTQVDGQRSRERERTRRRRERSRPSWAQHLLAGPAVAGIVSALRSVRPRVWVTAASALLALVAAVLVVPSGSTDATPAPAAAITSTASGTAKESGAGETPAARDGDDDPVVALESLLAQREECIRAASVQCLDAVHQQNSSSRVEDEELVRALQGGAETPAAWSLASFTLVERLGGSAIIEADDPAESEPASFLLVEGEAGWRIRDYLWR